MPPRGAVRARGVGREAAERELGFTLGIARTLLPFGDQIAALRWISTTWWLVIPAVALANAVVSGLVGGLVGSILAAAYNRSPRHASVVVEVPDEEAEALEPEADEATPSPGQ